MMTDMEKLLDKRIKIKICGIKSAKEAGYLNEFAVDYAGCVFYDKSRRFVTYDTAKDILKALDKDIKKVAVTVSPDIETVKRICELGFDILQVHKTLTEEVLSLSETAIWHALNISDEEGISLAESFYTGLDRELAAKVKGIVIDAPDFGSGKTFNWHRSKRMLKAGAQSPPKDTYEILKEREFILAGGLTAENVREGIEIFEPDIVDVSSSVEGVNGKDREKIRAFVNAVKGS